MIRVLINGVGFFDNLEISRSHKTKGRVEFEMGDICGNKDGVIDSGICVFMF